MCFNFYILQSFTFCYLHFYFFRILVLDEGLIKETGSPQDLLQNSNGVFYGMAKAAGLV